MVYLVVSDLHLGSGKYLESGEFNFLEDFSEDERFAQLLEYYLDLYLGKDEVTIIFNGDIFNLIEYENIEPGFEITEEITVNQLRGNLEGHPIFFGALKRFLSFNGTYCHFVFGNHDLPLVFEGAQGFLRHHISNKINFSHVFEQDGLYVEHGQRFEEHNHIPRGKEIVKNYKGENVIRLPWGSLFVMHLMPEFKRHRPFIDKLRPTSFYIKWCVLNDFSFFIFLLKRVLVYLIKTRGSYYLKLNPNYKTTLTRLRKINTFPHFSTVAKKIFEEFPHLEVVVLGHTHVAQWRKILTKKLYFNSGTWNTVNAVDLGKYKSSNKLHYVEVITEPESKKVKSALLKSWLGMWKPYKDEAGLGRS